MTKALIHSVISVNKCTLIVFYTDAHCWQFRVIGADGAVFGEQKLYYTAEAALNAGREWIGIGN
jgi:hypothetical protein